MTGIYKIVDSVNGLLWGKNILVFMLIGAALYFSFKTKFMQFRLFHKIIKVLFKNEKGKHGISSLETFFLGTACRVGAGNIAGVVAAISVGGAGSIFWMWLVAMLGSATAFIESSLAVIYRKKKKMVLIQEEHHLSLKKIEYEMVRSYLCTSFSGVLFWSNSSNV